MPSRLKQVRLEHRKLLLPIKLLRNRFQPALKLTGFSLTPNRTMLYTNLDSPRLSCLPQVKISSPTP